MVKAPVAVVPHVAPTEKSVRGNAAQGDKPPARVLERPVVARTAPPEARIGFSAQQPQLTAKPGRPLDDGARKELKAAAAAPAVKVIAETKVAPPTQRLPPATTAAAPADARGRSDDRKAPAAPVIADAPRAPTTQASAPSQAARPAPIAQPPEQRGKSNPAPQVAATVTEPKVAAPPPAVQSPQQSKGRTAWQGQSASTAGRNAATAAKWHSDPGGACSTSCSTRTTCSIAGAACKSRTTRQGKPTSTTRSSAATATAQGGGSTECRSATVACAATDANCSCSSAAATPARVE